MICWLAGISFADVAERAWPPPEKAPAPAPDCWSPDWGTAAPLAAAADGTAASGPLAIGADAAEDDAAAPPLPEHPASAAMPMMAIPEMASMCRRPGPPRPACRIP